MAIPPLLISVAKFSTRASIADMNRLSGLDAVRGVAALIVAVRHFQQTFRLPELPISAGVSVYMFFVLSGFVMARTYEPRMLDGLATGPFLKLRYRRLFLPMALGSTIGLTCAAFWSGLSVELLAGFFAILIFLPAPWLPHAFLFNPPAWSLFVEIVCNALHPAIIAMARRLTAPIILCFVLWALFASVGLARWQAGATGILTMLPGSIGCYLLGVFVHRRFGDAPLGNASGLAISGLVIASALVWLAPPSLEPLLVLIACPLILRTALAMGNNQWAFWIGAWSFPLYATHEPVMRLCRIFGLGYFDTAAAVLAVSISVTLAVTSTPPLRIRLHRLH